jgi:TPR repeat protein
LPQRDTGETFLGMMHANGEGKAAEGFREAAGRGYPEAETGLGLIYQQGRGVPQDYPAVKWPQSGQTSAQARLGSMYALGKSATRNYIEAVKWCTKAAEQGEAPAQALLGLMYEQGRGVTQD